MSAADSAQLTVRMRPLGGTGPQHPSPGRVLGALLSGAHRSGDDAALAAVSALATLDQPSVELPVPAGTFRWEAASATNPTPGWNRKRGKIVHVSRLGLGNVSETLNSLDTMTPDTSRDAALTMMRRDHVLGDYTFRTRDPDGKVDRAALSIAAAHVTSFGAGSDPAVCLVSDDQPEHGARVWVPSPFENVGRSWRVWSGDLIDWYNDQYDAVFGDASIRSSFQTDRRVREGRWVLRRHGHSETRAVLRVRGRGFAQRNLPWMLSQVHGTDEALPMVDGAGLVRGISFPSGDPVTLDPEATWFDPLAEDLLTCDPRRWVGTGSTQRWVSATPVCAPSDESVARWIIAGQLDEGDRLVSLTRRPVHPRHTGEVKPLPTRPGFSRWWAVITAERDTELRVGEFTDEGFGVMRPLAAENGKDQL